MKLHLKKKKGCSIISCDIFYFGSCQTSVEQEKTACALRAVFSADSVCCRALTVAQRVSVCNYVFSMLMMDCQGTEVLNISGKT